MDDATDRGPIAAPPDLTPVRKRRVAFSLRCRCGAKAAYVAIADEAARRVAFEPMVRVGHTWRLSLRLPPGTYRYRYYVGDGRTVAYFAPSDAGVGVPPVRMDGLDAVLVVAAPAARAVRRTAAGRASGNLYDSGPRPGTRPRDEPAPPATGDD